LPSRFHSEQFWRISLQAFGRRRDDLHDVVANGVQDQLAYRMNVQFAHEIRTMRFRRLYTETESHCNFLRTFSLGEQLHNLALARGQHIPGNRLLRSAFEVSLENDLGNF
jgi:hypothetical protein